MNFIIHSATNNYIFIDFNLKCRGSFAQIFWDFAQILDKCKFWGCPCSPAPTPLFFEFLNELSRNWSRKNVFNTFFNLHKQVDLRLDFVGCRTISKKNWIMFDCIAFFRDNCTQWWDSKFLRTLFFTPGLTNNRCSHYHSLHPDANHAGWPDIN